MNGRLGICTIIAYTLFSMFHLSSGAAATLNVVGGTLLGASNVLVKGTKYDVEFFDGTCVAIYAGCNDASDFTFNTSNLAILASEALLDQVFTDSHPRQFDTNPDRVFGCADPAVCEIFTPYTLASGLRVGTATNWRPSSGHPDATSLSSPATLLDTAASPPQAYALWTLAPVPVPASIYLLGSGLAGLFLVGRRRKCKEVEGL